MINTWQTHLKPGEGPASDAGKWNATRTVGGHIVAQSGGHLEEREAVDAVSAPNPEHLGAGAVVWVHAREYLDRAGMGGGGFDWFYTKPPARRAFETDPTRADTTHGNFLFPYTLPRRMSRDVITEEIDRDLPGLCAATPPNMRFIGAELLATWNRFGYEMGQNGKPESESENGN